MNIFIINPRGFCAGVKRAIKIVELALEKYGPPVYVRHNIVHNSYVIADLSSRGAVFLDNIDDIPYGAVTIFSAHGVSLAIEECAKNKRLKVIDATCPLVKAVHKQLQICEKKSRNIIIIGNPNHEEIKGTVGRSNDPNTKLYVVHNIKDLNELPIPNRSDVSYVTQTTLNQDEAKIIADAIKAKFNVVKPCDNICFATKNRQDAVKQLINIVDFILVIGDKESSNSNKLRDVAKGHLISCAKEIKLSWFSNCNNVGITAGASAPEYLVQEVIEHIKANFKVQKVEEFNFADESNIEFSIA